MLFPTVEFALFFFCVFTFSWLLQKQARARKLFLLIASYYFYAYWDWRFAFLLAECSVMNYVIGLVIVSCRSEVSRKVTVALGVGLNLAVLGFFKYFDFFSVSVNQSMVFFGLEPTLPLLEVILPVGVSFFTFQGISYIVDIYRKKIPAEDSMLDVLLYISFFPQLVAGPIVRASTFIPQLKRKISSRNIRTGTYLLLIAGGLFKKIVIANYLATDLVGPIFEDPQKYSSLDALFGLYGYAIQIFCDFSAYSDIAIGVAGLLGYVFPENFDQPYRAATIREFWRRWHISLSTWLKDYLYHPLGGSKGSGWQTKRNLFLVMLAAGIWHGAAWTFVLFGIMHGLLVVIESMIFKDKKVEYAKPWQRALGILFTFHFVCFTLAFFAADSLSTSWVYLQTLFSFDFATTQINWLHLLLIAIGLGMNFMPKDFSILLKDWFTNRPLILQATAVAVFLMIIGALSPEGIAPFIYYRF